MKGAAYLPHLTPPTPSAATRMIAKIIDYRLRGLPLSWRIREDQALRETMLVIESSTGQELVNCPLPEFHQQGTLDEILDEAIRKASPPPRIPRPPRPRASFRPSLYRGRGRDL